MLRDRIWGIFFACMSLGYLGFWLAGQLQIMGMFLGLIAAIAAFYYLRLSDLGQREMSMATPNVAFERVEPAIPPKKSDQQSNG